ncbi:MAG: LamG-like jellyroll fold domain-containing protein [bacterium]
MNLIRSRLFLILALAFLITSAGLSGSSYAQSVAGTVKNQSVWLNFTIANPPGDGSVSGTLRVGAWASGSTISGPPAYTFATAASGVLPFAYGSSYGYAVPIAVNGDYQVMAWIDSPGSGIGGYDLGEPRSEMVAKSVTNAMSGVNLTVTDDSDADGLPDWWEVHYFNDLDETAGGDADNDGLSNLTEYQISQAYPGLANINPANWDTDGDGMDDAWEFDHYADGTGTDPCVSDKVADPDGDGLSNWQEYCGVDGQPPKERNPVLPGNVARTRALDTGDVLNPVDIDTDNDGLIDSFEAAWYDPSNGINPKSAGSYAADSDQDGLSNYREQCLLAALVQGGVDDSWTLGPGSLPIVDGNGLRAFSSPVFTNVPPLLTIENARSALRRGDATDLHQWTDPSHGSGFVSDLPVEDSDGWDTDNDGLPDGWEVEFNLDPKDADGVNGAFGNPDGDAFPNIMEYNGQDGNRALLLGYINGTGDETNPKEHNWRPQSTYIGTGTWRDDTLGSARPTTSVGVDVGLDTDDDGIADDREIQLEYEGVHVGASPVHSMDPFVKRSALITDAAGIVIPDTEGGFRKDLCSRDWTFECQVKLASNNLSGTLLDMPNGTPVSLPFAYRVSLSNDVPVVSFCTLGGYKYAVSGLALPTNTWVHIAGVWDHATNSLSLYVGGIFVQEQRVYEEGVSRYMLDGPTNSPSIGMSPDGSFAGQLYIDEVRIWTKARSAADVEQYRTKFVAQDTAGLAAYYRFDDGGVSAEDFTRKAKSGLLGAVRNGDYHFGDFGYALQTNSFAFITNDFAAVRGVDAYGADDSDGDGLPDAWEMINHLDPFSALGIDGADGDPDGDGLSNIYEYWSHTNPKAPNTDGSAELDGDKDYDNDGVINIIEQQLGSRPDLADTDDDGVSDGTEMANGTSAVNPTDPAIPRSISFGGAPGDYIAVPTAFKQRLADWTIEAWANPTNSIDGAGKIVERIVATPASGTNVVNFVLGLETNAGGLRAYAGFVPTHGTSVFVRVASIPAGTWTHLAASYDSLNARLTIYTNGAPGASTSTVFQVVPRNGKGGETSLRIGQDFGGLVDDVRIWNDVRSAAEIKNNLKMTVDNSTQGLIHYFRFDDGGVTAQDFTETDDWNEEWRHAATLAGNTAFVLGAAIGVPPSVSVTFEPPEVRLDAQWTFDGGAWNNHGEVIVTTEGAHTISYKSLVGWTAPPAETVALSNNQAVTISRTYIQDGGLQVFLEPGLARLNGALWQIDGGVWQTSGTILSNVAAGAHTLNFALATNYFTPPSQGITIDPGVVLPLTVNYLPIQGSAVIMLEPSAVVSNGAQWRIDGGGWLDSGTLVSNLVFGTHTVEFLPIIPWITPSNIILTVADGSRLVNTGRYTQITGIQVIISPPAAIAGGAKWRIGSGAWLDSGTQVAMSPGQYTIAFNTVANWIAPNESSVSVVNGLVSLIQASYYDLDIFGSTGTGAGQLRQPRGLAITDRYLYVADSGNNRIQILDTLNSKWTVLGSYGAKAGQFNQPYGVCLDPSGNLWVADAGNHRIQRRDAVTGAWAIFGNRGTAVGQFVEPFDVVSDSAGNIYVADHYNHRVQKRSVSGVWSIFINNGRNNGFVRFPNGLGVDAANNLYVSDFDSVTGVSRAQKFTSGGVFSMVMGISGGAGSLSTPMGLSVNSSTNLFLADAGNHQVQVANATGSWSVVLSSMFLSTPHDVETDMLGDVYISDSASNRIVRLPNHDAINLKSPYLYNQYSSGQVGVWNLNTNGTFKSASLINAAATPWLVRASGDIDGDGTADLFWQLPTGQVTCWLMNSNGTRRAGLTVYAGTTTWQIRGAGDIDLDGIADLVWQLPTGQAACWLMNTNGTAKATLSISGSASPWQIRGVGDIDADGVADLVWQLPAGNVACWLMNPACTIKSTFYIYNAATSWVVRCGGDIDGDGSADLIWQLPAGQTAGWLLNPTGTLKSGVNVFARRTAAVIRGSGR